MARTPPPPLDAAMDDVAAGRSTSLDLSVAGRGLAGVPFRVRRLRSLRTLVLGPQPQLDALPVWLDELPQLEYINARWSPITRMPALPTARWVLTAETLLSCQSRLDVRKVEEVSLSDKTSLAAVDNILALSRRGDLQLTRLTYRAATDTDQDRASVPQRRGVDPLDEIIRQQTGLRKLVVQGRPLARVPEPLRDLRDLEMLTLREAELTSVPDWLLALPSLSTLDLSQNRLTDVPLPSGERSPLHTLMLTGNPLARIPDVVWHLEALETLGLADCLIEEIPSDVLWLENLRTLALTGLGTPPAMLVTPPPEVVAQGLDAIKAYWRQEREAGVDHLAEAKLLIVGEPGAGKTSLTHKILDPAYELDTGEPSTEGIDVLPWEFPGVIRVRGGERERVLQRDIRINIWDFGGQEIYHSTHQFFLTKRSVYALVTDERKEDTDFEYWLEIIDLLSDGSPVLIVQNRKHGRSQGLDIGKIRQRYPNMREALVLDLADNVGLDVAVDRIRRELEALPHIGTPLPTTWREVRLAMEDDVRDHMTAEEFFTVCTDKGFRRADDMRQLGGFLHDLGICLFFQDDPLLRRTVILKPEWGTTAVYRVLDDPEIADAMGLFNADDLERIWHESRFASMRHELLRLMERFGLCYRVPGSTTWIAPQLLSPTQPVYSWPEDGNTAVRYEYDVMPKGIVRRLIVDLHNLLLPGNHVWRSGGVFTYGSARAEVVEDYGRRRLYIRLQGSDPRVLLGIIDQALSVIHASYPRIRFLKFLPCICMPCAAARDPAVFAVSELEDFARTGDQIQCRSSRKMVDPLTVLRTTSTDVQPLMPSPTTPDGEESSTRSKPEVFVSYHWGGAGEVLVDELQVRLADRGVPTIRDKLTMRYRDSIRTFMRALGTGKCIVVVVDDGYLRSANCMFELTEIAKDPSFATRVFPVIMSDAAIFKPGERLGYVKHWEDEIRELDSALREVGPENLQGIREERDLYETIRNTIAGIVDVLADMNALTPDVHRDEDFARMYQALEASLAR